MQVEKITISLTPNEMFDLAYALESHVDSNIFIYPDTERDELLNDFESDLEILQTFVSNGYQLSISENSKEGYTINWESNPKVYLNTKDWFNDLLIQRRKEKLNREKDGK